jgi:DNA-binding transcriptional ArsR family regulator
MTDLFKVLGNSNRRNILKILLKKEIHLSALARELNIAVPVALKHIRILEDAGLIERTLLGKSHLIKIKKEAAEKIVKALGLLEKPFIVEVEKGTKVIDALREVSGIEIEKKSDGYYITGVDGQKGYYIYEVNGKLPNKAIDKFEIKNDCEIELKKLVPVIGKKILIKTKK